MSRTRTVLMHTFWRVSVAWQVNEFYVLSARWTYLCSASVTACQCKVMLVHVLYGGGVFSLHWYGRHIHVTTRVIEICH